MPLFNDSASKDVQDCGSHVCLEPSGVQPLTGMQAHSAALGGATSMLADPPNLPEDPMYNGSASKVLHKASTSKSDAVDRDLAAFATHEPQCAIDKQAMLHVETYHGSGIENGNPDQSPTGGKSVKNDATTVYASKNPARACENACAKKDSFTCLENEIETIPDVEYVPEGAPQVAMFHNLVTNGQDRAKTSTTNKVVSASDAPQSMDISNLRLADAEESAVPQDLTPQECKLEVQINPEDVHALSHYRWRCQKVVEQNLRYYSRYPDDRAKVMEIVHHLVHKGSVALPSGGQLTPACFLPLGKLLSCAYACRAFIILLRMLLCVLKMRLFWTIDFWFTLKLWRILIPIL